MTVGGAHDVAEMRVAAPAKINLYLHVVGRRTDGYHELDSLVAFADIADFVTARPAADLSLAVNGPFAAALGGAGADNLVLQAACLLASHCGVTAGAALRLTKNLPVASGIGGGSSDAAASLRALQTLWKLQPSVNDLGGLAARLGADVPICLLGRPAWLGGIGELLAPAPALPPVSVVLANPGIALATPAVFKARRGPFSAPSRFAGSIPDAAGLAQLLASRRNDLTEAAIGIVPAVADVLARLAACEGALIARMSGSGATCFALFAETTAARAAATRISGERPGWWVAAGRLAAASDRGGE
jgi:4-diphosphocytidyl-2-C-methyl-D-erythritol kinase